MRNEVSYYHYDPYSHVLSKVVRGFERDLEDAHRFVRSGMVEPSRLRKLVEGIPEAAYSRYPNVTGRAVRQAVEEFLSTL